jgi:16S rRNA (cytosine967-C5)-methyltransferase
MNPGASPNPAWEYGFSAAVAFATDPRKADELMADRPLADPADRRRAHRLFLGWLRHRGLAAEALRPFLRRAPRVPAQCLLEFALAEQALAPAERHPAIVHHAVARAKAHLSPAEAAMINAVLRRAGPLLPRIDPAHSHPSWLVEGWRRTFGPEATAALLRWNQTEAPLYLRWAGGAAPPDLGSTPWPGFFRVEGGQVAALLPAVARGEAYFQDPFTRHPVELALAARPRRLLDLCAAPGGKTRALLDALPPGGDHLLGAVDLPGPRLERLRANLAVSPAAQAVKVLGADLGSLSSDQLTAAGLPPPFDAIILDVPCSNTGVIGRRPDVRWLLTPDRLRDLVDLQARLLAAAAPLVASGGVLVYSTCSLEPEENERQVEAFLRHHPDFRLGEPRLSRPWLDHHDGGAAFPLTRL